MLFYTYLARFTIYTELDDAYRITFYYHRTLYSGIVKWGPTLNSNRDMVVLMLGTYNTLQK